MLRKPLLAFALAQAVLAFASAAVAQNDPAAPVYRCKAPGGAVTYQDYACKGGIAVDIKPDAADPAAIQRLRQAQARFDRSLAQRRAAEMATRREPPERRRATARAPGYDGDVQVPDASDVPGYLLYGPVPPAKLERRNRRIEHRVVAPGRRAVPGVIRRLRPA
ncbi:MAG TPA: hypothetical protein VFO53_13960 [Casimicrobiaceae bacterium]|nr:hypothetical protein [Casimicrobiaceae bacterium]